MQRQIKKRQIKKYTGPLWLTAIVFIAAIISGCSGRSKIITISNPSGLIKTSVYADSAGRLTYSVTYNGKSIIGSSPLGIIVDRKDLGKGVEIGTPAFSLTWEKYPGNGVHEISVNHYRQAIIPVIHAGSGTHYQLEIKAFDEGIAFRYVVPGKGISTVNGEASSWKIPKGSTVWFQENVFYYEGLYYASPLSKLGTKRMGPPVTYQTGDSIYVSITEAALYHYSGMSLQSDSNGLLRAAFVNDPNGWKSNDTIFSPWRVAIAATNLNTLVNADIITSLNPPQISNPREVKWIKPGRAVWSYFRHDNVTTMSLEKKYIDKAALLGFEYSMVDAGWESSWRSSMDSLKSLVAYALARHVGIWVWKSYTSLKKDSTRRDFFRALHQIGVAGVKIDFIDKEGLAQIDFYENALKDAMAARLMIDFHGANKPTGYSRTYPNELTREAIYGQEWRTYTPQGPVNNAITPFTRFLAGPGDYTPGVFDSKKAYGTSRAHQLALPILYLSPLTCWPDDPDVYLASPALPLIRSIPTVWDQTVVLSPSRIGELVAFARRKGNDWYLGIINAGNEKSIVIPLGFLGKGTFETDMFPDDMSNSDHLFHEKTSYTSRDSLHIMMRPSGGYAAMLKKNGAPGSHLSIIPRGGELFAPVTVQMKTDPGMAIRYTTDGSTPGPYSTLYSKPFTIKDPVLVQARAFNGSKPAEALAVAQFLAAAAPVLSAPEGIFIGTQTLSMRCASVPGIIRYTTDGSDPSGTSAIYKDSLRLSSTTLLNARTFFVSGTTSARVVSMYSKVKPSPALSPAGRTPGLIAGYYEGSWTFMPDFMKLPRGRSSVVADPDLGQLPASGDYYAVRFDGYLYISSTGVYNFSINSDDGSQLYLDDRKLIDNDGCHGNLEKSGAKALAAGLHRFRLNYFQHGSGQTLQAFIKEPGLPKKIIPPALFFH